MSTFLNLVTFIKPQQGACPPVYRPKYITKYIVENTVGKLCEEKRTEQTMICLSKPTAEVM